MFPVVGKGTRLIERRKLKTHVTMKEKATKPKKRKSEINGNACRIWGCFLFI
jgi:hypothetical protein